MRNALAFCLFWLSGTHLVRAFSPGASLEDCPKIPPVDQVKLDKVTGTWRVAYLYIDDVGDIEEDDSCGVVEIVQVNETNLALLLYVDHRKNEAVIDRYTKEFEVNVRSSGQWLINTSFIYLEFIHVTVIGFFGDHLILMFCSTPFVSAFAHDKMNEIDKNPSRSSLDAAVEKTDLDDIFKESSARHKMFRDVISGMDEYKLKKSDGGFFRRRRYAGEDDGFENIFGRQMNKRPKKHLWTAVLTRNNKVSALAFVENASYLMKLGFDISKGQLIGLGSCRSNK